MGRVIAEVGDMSRFDNPRQLMAYLGLVPGEHLSGEAGRLTGITHHCTTAPCGAGLGCPSSDDLKQVAA